MLNGTSKSLLWQCVDGTRASMPIVLVLALIGAACGASQSTRVQPIPGHSTDDAYAKLEAAAQSLGWPSEKVMGSSGALLIGLNVYPGESERILVREVFVSETAGSPTMVSANELYFNCGSAPDDLCGAWVDKLMDASGLGGPATTAPEGSSSAAPLPTPK